MATRNFEALNREDKKNLIAEAGRVTDITDPKWGHPDGRDFWYIDPALNIDTATLYNPEVSDEEKLALGNKRQAAYMEQWWNTEHTCTCEKYMVPGCPEEPDTECEVWVIKPKNIKPRKNRVLFYIVGGALVSLNPNAYPIEKLCEEHKCVGIVPIYRLSWQAKYPAAINDCHAAYKWMVDNADMLGIHPNKVVLSGSSSGGHLALATGFRLKRYGYNPRGIVTVSAQTDDREKDGPSNYSGVWDSVEQHDGLLQYMGRNFASNKVGPEAMPNHATVEDCIGYPPVFMHQSELDPDILNNVEFYTKLLKAHSFAEYHVYGGAHHNNGVFSVVKGVGEPNDYSMLVGKIFDTNLEDCFRYDLRRPWVVEEYKAAFKEKFGE